ncbi:MAG: hypothetical protein AAF289_04870 [Cyanobacteria bacterium P01_A01_bin.135]
MSDRPELYVITTDLETIVTERDTPRGSRSGEDIGGGFGPTAAEQITKLVRKRVPLDAAALKTQMNGLINVVGDIFAQADAQTGMQLSEVELSVEINGEGKVSIVGNGGKIANTGGITLKFTRPS